MKVLILPCGVLVVLSTSSPLTYAVESDVISVPGSPGPATKQITFVKQTLQSGLDGSTFPLITLEPVSSAKIQTLEQRTSLPTQIGFSRNVVQLASTENTSQQLNWHKLLDNSNSTGLQIHSPQALALRIGMTIDNLPENAEFRFFNMQDGAAVNIKLVSARKILALLERNRKADPSDPDGKIFWSPTVTGDTLGVEIYLPENEDPSSVQIAFPLVSHITTLPFGSPTLKYSPQVPGASDPCQNDATCAISWMNLNRSVAGMQFTTSGGTFICTGSLLNDIDPDTWEPYFISANHCISTQAAASTLETHWFWESAFCNGLTQRSTSYERITGGATLLHTQGMDSGVPTSSSMDTTLLRLNSAPPRGAVFAGWTTAVPPGIGTSRTGIHHPLADWKKISYGFSGGDWACWWINENEFQCNIGRGNFYQVNWTIGGTEGGSSGSAIYYNTDYVIGTLTGGSGSCGGSSSMYSSFRAAYAAGNYGQWLFTAPELPSPVVAPMNLLLLR